MYGISNILSFLLGELRGALLHTVSFSLQIWFLSNLCFKSKTIQPLYFLHILLLLNKQFLSIKRDESPGENIEITWPGFIPNA